MRTTTAPELALLATPTKRLAYKVEITNAAGAWVDYTALLGADWVLSISGGITLDEPIPTFELEVRRDHDGDSLSPFRGDSILNTGGAAIDGRRLVRISTAYSAWGAVPGAMRVVELGIIDTPDFSQPNIRLSGRNYVGARLVDNWIRAEQDYGSEPGTRLDLVMQDVIDDWSPGITLDVPVLPAFLVTTYTQQVESVWDALRALAGTIGWDVRILWNETAGEFRPALIQPDRAKTVPDYTLDPAFIYRLEQLSIDTTWLRNVIRVTFVNEDGEPDYVEVSDAASITRFNGELYGEIIRGDGSPINTTAEATDLANAALSDLSWPIADQVVHVPYFWPAELGDLFRFTANGIHYNGNLDLAVTGMRWEIRPKSARTWLTARGKPAGFYRSWIRHEERLNVGIEVQQWAPVHDDATGDTVTYVGRLQGTEAWVYEVLAQQPVNPDIWDTIENVSNLTDVLLPDAEMKISDVYDVPDEGWVRYVRVQPYRVVGGVYTAGDAQDAVVYPKSAQPPVIRTSHKEDGAIGTAWIQVQLRGIPVVGITVRSQVGNGEPSAAIAPLRDAGDPSVVIGGTLATGEYEHDVTLDASRITKLIADIELATGEVLTVTFGFDRNIVPDFLSEPWFDGTILRGITGDTDANSIRIERLNSPWVYNIDARLAQPIDVTANDPSGNAGQTNPSVAIYRVTLFSDPIGDIDGATHSIYRDLQLEIGSSGEPVWSVAKGTEPLIGSDVFTLELQASAAPVGYTAEVWARSRDKGGSWTVFADITGDLSPALSAPPTALTSYTYATGFDRIAKDVTQPIREFEFRCDILNGSAVVVASVVIPKQWYRGPL